MSKYRIGDKVHFLFNGKECSGEIYDILHDPDEYAIITKDVETDCNGVVFSVTDFDEFQNKGLNIN
jgi:hypothetical protein